MLSTSRLIAIGDVHGCLQQLVGLVEKIQPKPWDKLVFLGDLINFGPSSKEVIDYLLQLEKKTPCVFLRGDAEHLLLDAVSYSDIEVTRFIQAGGGATWKSYGGAFDKIPKDHIDFFERMLLYHVEEGHLFVHAGLQPGRSIERQKVEDLVSIREDYIWAENEWDKIIVSGHTPIKKPKVTRDGKIFLDTGAGHSDRIEFGALTACDVRRTEFFSV